MTLDEKAQRYWSVTVSIDGEEVLTIGKDELAGVPNIEDHANEVRECGRHLLAFIGEEETDSPAAPAPTVSGDEKPHNDLPGTSKSAQDLKSSPTRAEVLEEAWDDCKVAFGVDDQEALEQWMDDTDDGKELLPSGWSLNEVDCSGARCVAVFRVEGELRKSDGMKVAAILRALAGEKP